MKKTVSRSAFLALAAMAGLAVGGCAGMSEREKSTAVGAGVGALGGAILSGGSAVGTVGGAAVGGVIGNQVGKDKK
jgi:osmotically inducible lipoprotein OsmB